MADRIKGITVEIGGDTTGLSKALSGVNKEIGSTQKQLKDVERLLKLDPTNTELLRQKYDLLTKAVDSTEVKLQSLKNAEQQVQAQFQRGNIGEEQYNALKRELIETESKLRDLKTNAKQTENAVNGIDEKPVKEVADAADEAKDSLQKAGKEASNFGDYLKAEAIVEGVKGIASGLKDVAEESKEYMKIMASLEISSQNAGYTAEETAQTYKTLYGVLGDDQTAATTTANLQALKLSQQQLTEVVNGTIGAWATYGDSIPIDSLSEAMNETIKTGTVTGTFADVLNWAGTSEDDFNAKLQAANSETERANIVLQELASQGLINAGQAWQENNKSLVESNQANAELSDSLARLSEEVMPIMTKITDAISKLINFILDNKDAVMTALVAIGAGFAAFKITGIVTSLFSGFQKLFSAIKTGTPIMQALNTTMSANPIGLIISAIAALVSAFIYLWNNCEAFRQFWITLWENIKQVFTNVWNAIVGFFTETIPNAWQTVVDMFNAAVDWWNGLWQGVGDFFKGIWDGICSFFTQTIPNAWNQVKSMFDRVGQWWNNLWQGVSNTFKRIWDGFVDIAKAPINGIIWLINKAIDGINWIIDGINSIGFDVPDWLGGGHVGFQIGKINNLPYLAKGGTLSSGSAIVGEKGPELLTMLDGGKARVTPLTNSQKQQGSFLTGGITINIDSFTNNDTTKDVKQLTAYIMDEINMAAQRKAAVFS